LALDTHFKEAAMADPIEGAGTTTDAMLLHSRVPVDEAVKIQGRVARTADIL
jgi:hypothetical protein